MPVKSFAKAKRRLEPVLGPTERAALSRRLARRVLHAAGPLASFVACDDEEVAEWARSEGAGVLWTPGLGLSGAVAAAIARLGTEGHDDVTVAHSDLPLVESFEGFGRPGTVTIAPDRRFQGTNVISVPATAGFVFSYGPGSFQRHRAEATRIGLACHVVHDWRLAADVDDPVDLTLVTARGDEDSMPGPVQRSTLTPDA